MLHTLGLAALPCFRDYRSRRVSSYDRTGGNRDWYDIAPGERRTIADIRDPGCIRHIWCTMLPPDDSYYRRVVIRFYWDDAAEPSVECPIGDFFGLGHARRKDFTCAVMQMSPQDGRGFNCWWPMPFRRACRVEIENQGDQPHTFYFYIDYEEYDSPAAVDGQGYFHVQWRRENPTRGWGNEHKKLWVKDRKAWMEKTWFGGDKRSLNTTGRDNYVILETLGDGIYCGAHLDIDIFERQKNDWYGEGDDMVFIDDAVGVVEGTGNREQGTGKKGSAGVSPARSGSAGVSPARSGSAGVSPARRATAKSRTNSSRRERLAAAADLPTFPRSHLPTPQPPSHLPTGAAVWPRLVPAGPPTLHGTGTEDWCNTAFGPSTEYCAPYHGILLYSGTPGWKWRGKQSIYRYYIEDPIRFRTAILATIEHGHANKLSNDYSSTAYYYLSKPQRGGPPLPDVKKRLPRADEREYV